MEEAEGQPSHQAQREIGMVLAGALKVGKVAAYCCADLDRNWQVLVVAWCRQFHHVLHDRPYLYLLVHGHPYHGHRDLCLCRSHHELGVDPLEAGHRSSCLGDSKASTTVYTSHHHLHHRSS